MFSTQTEITANFIHSIEGTLPKKSKCKEFLEIYLFNMKKNFKLAQKKNLH